MVAHQRSEEEIAAQRAKRHAEYIRARDADPERLRAMWRAAWKVKYAKGARRSAYKRSTREPNDVAAASKRQRYARDPEPFQQRDRLRYEWLKSGDVTADELRSIWERGGGNCHYCGVAVVRPRFYKGAPRGFDHVISRTRGGQHTASNIVVCCQPCNAKKGNR
jgi:5-methylcytosine-specific restriction endonuclease McrA